MKESMKEYSRQSGISIDLQGCRRYNKSSAALFLHFKKGVVKS